MSNKFKFLVEQIKKYAGPSPNPASGSSPIAGATDGRPRANKADLQTNEYHGTPSPHGTFVPYGPPNPYGQAPKSDPSQETVKDMQAAMKDLSDQVTQDPQADAMPKSQHDSVQTKAPQQIQDSKTHFNDFIAQQYMNPLNDDEKGEEYHDDKDHSWQAKQTNATGIYSLDGVMKTLKDTGSQFSEQYQDGIWSFRTQNALKNILAFSKGLLQFQHDLIPDSNNVFSASMWENFKDVLDNVDKTVDRDNHSFTMVPKMKADAAKYLTKYIGLIKKQYFNFRQNVLANTSLRTTIEGQRSFDSYNSQGSNKDVLTPQDNSLLKNPNAMINVKFPAAGSPASGIPLSALVNKEAYFDYMRYVGNDEAMAVKLLPHIKQQIESMQ